MNESKKRSAEIIQIIESHGAQRVEAVTSEIFRRIKIPLKSIKGRAERLKGQLEYDQKENTQGILDQIEQLENFVGKAENFVRPKSQGPESFNLYENSQEMASFFQMRISQSQIDLMNLIPVDLEVDFRKAPLQQILMSLFLNSIQRLEQSPQKPKQIFFHYQESKSDQIISIEDNCNTEVAFQSNPGLTLCQKIAEAQGWRMQIKVHEKQGCRIDIFIPL